jgi:hypothetical protein
VYPVIRHFNPLKGEPRFREHSGLICLLTECMACQQVVIRVIVTGNAVADTHILHETPGTYSFQVSRKMCPDLVQGARILPNVPDMISARMPKAERWYVLPDTAESVRPIVEYPKYREDSTAPAVPPGAKQ